MIRNQLKIFLRTLLDSRSFIQSATRKLSRSMGRPSPIERRETGRPAPKTNTGGRFSTISHTRHPTLTLATLPANKVLITRFPFDLRTIPVRRKPNPGYSFKKEQRKEVLPSNLTIFCREGQRNRYIRALKKKRGTEIRRRNLKYARSGRSRKSRG